MSFEFDDAIALTDNPTTALLPKRWTKGPGFAHGGYLMSVALAGAAKVSPQPDPVTMSAHFTRPGRVGQAEVRTELVKAGRSLATVRSDIVQQDKVAMSTITTFGDLSTAGDVSFQSVTMPDIPQREHCLEADPVENAFLPAMAANIDLLLTPDSVAFTQGTALEQAKMCGWVRFSDSRPIDAVSLPMFADAFPPPVFNVGASISWMPTVEFTLHFRRRPETQWLRMAFQTGLVGGPFVESSGTLWDDDGRLVAMSRQLQFIQQR